MAHIITGTVYRLLCAVDGVPRPWLTIEATSMDAADTAALAHFAVDPESAGKQIRVLAADEVKFAG